MIVQELQGASVALSLVSRLLYLEPDAQMIRVIVDERVFDEVPFGAGAERVEGGLSLLRAWCDEARCSEERFEEMVGALRREWLLVFTGLGLPKAPSWASYYTDPGARILSPDTLVTRGWYKRFGLQIERLHNEPDDHLGLMLAFAAHLAELEANCRLGEGGRWTLEELVEAQEQFLVDQVLPWLPAWYDNAAKESQSSFFKGLSDLIFGLCEASAARFGIRFNAEKNKFAYTRA